MKTRQFVLPDMVASPQDLLVVILEVRSYAKWYAHEAIMQRISKKRGATQPVLSASAQKIILDWNDISAISTRSLSVLIATLESYAKNTDTITITLAAPATNTIKLPLVAWCRQNISPGVFVSFQFNSTLLGGMVVRYGSRVFDWSFRRQILASSAQFPKVLRRV